MNWKLVQEALQSDDINLSLLLKWKRGTEDQMGQWDVEYVPRNDTSAIGATQIYPEADFQKPFRQAVMVRRDIATPSGNATTADTQQQATSLLEADPWNNPLHTQPTEDFPPGSFREM